MVKLISPKYKRTYPEMIRNELYAIVEMMSRAEHDNGGFLYVYCVLKAAYDLLRRYETTCRETIFVAELEKNESEMRKKIIKMQKQTLHEEMSVLGLFAENIEL